MKESRKPFHYLVVDVLVNFARNIIFSKSRAQKLGIRFRFEIFLLVFRFPLPCLHVERKNKENISNQTTIHRLNTTIQWTNFFCKDSISNIDDMRFIHENTLHMLPWGQLFNQNPFVRLFEHSLGAVKISATTNKQ